MRVTTYLLVLLGAAVLAPPVRAAAPDDLLSRYSLTSWNDGDGRPLGSVHAVVQGNDGYLWIGSDAGLFRFDGSLFTAWSEIGDAPLPAGPVHALHVDRDGSLWVGFDRGEIRRIRERRLDDVPPFPDSHGAVTDFAQDADGAIWVVSNRVLYRLEGGGWTRVALPWPDREGLVLQPYVGRNGDLWIATRWGVFRRRSGTETFELLSHEYVFSISEDPAGQIWTTDIARGFTRLGAPVEGSAALEGAGYRVMHDRKGNLWIATFGKGLWQLAAGEVTGAVKRATRRSGLFSDSVQALAEDRDGNIWIGTTAGLHRLTEHVLTPLDNVGFVTTVEAHVDGHVWGGTSNGVVRFSSTPTEARQRASDREDSTCATYTATRVDRYGLVPPTDCGALMKGLSGERPPRSTCQVRCWRSRRTPKPGCGCSTATGCSTGTERRPRRSISRISAGPARG